MTTNENVLADIRSHAEAIYPEECCGFLLGDLTTETCHVEAIHPVENTEEERKTRRYEITPGDYQSAQKHAEADGNNIVGFYHSHPDHPARPSQTDLNEATFPGYRYVIVSVQQGTSAELTAWRLRPDRSEFINEDISTSSISTTPTIVVS